MSSWIVTIFGVAVYIGIGSILSKVTTDHINELGEKVWEIDPRYEERLWYHIPITITPVNKFLVEIAFTVIWPIFCIIAILKAEREYDLIVHRSAFTNRTVR